MKVSCVLALSIYIWRMKVIKLIVDNISVPIKTIKFSDGASSIKLEVPDALVKYPPSAYYSITVDPVTPADNYLWEILLVQDAIKRTFKARFNKRLLNLPYLPHARADRVFEEGNPFPLDVFLWELVDRFDQILLTDPHSDYYKEYNDSMKFFVNEQWECFNEVCLKDIRSCDVLVAPDKGSLAKIHKLQQKLDQRTIATYVIEAGKKRDIETGRVIETTLPDGCDLTGKTCWIVDDICAGGATFRPLAQKLKEAGAAKVYLYVTHGIFDKGVTPFWEFIDRIYTYQIIGEYLTQKDISNFNKTDFQ